MDEPEDKEAHSGLHSGLYGWKKRCLYTILLLLLLVVTTNVTLVIWIIRVLKINHYGVAGLQSVSGGVQLTGQVVVLDTLVSSKLRTLGHTILLQSSDNITLSADHSRHFTSNIYLGKESLELQTSSFQVRDARGKPLFSVDKDAVSLTTPTLSISGEGGAVLDGILQTPLLSAEIRSDLTLESANKSVHAVTATGVSVENWAGDIRANSHLGLSLVTVYHRLESANKSVHAVTATGVSVESRAGDIRANSHLDLSLVTVEGAIKLESANILLPNLRHPKNSRQPRRHHHHHPERIYQLCVCKDGDLFLGEAETPCDTSMCL